jgi:hypothetical protein
MEWDTTLLGNTRWLRGVYDFHIGARRSETKVKSDDNQMSFRC